MKLGDVYALDNGLVANLDFWCGLHFGITVSNGEQFGFSYLNGVSRWLDAHGARLTREGDGGYSDARTCKHCTAAGLE